MFSLFDALKMNVKATTVRKSDSLSLATHCLQNRPKYTFLFLIFHIAKTYYYRISLTTQKQTNIDTTLSESKFRVYIPECYKTVRLRHHFDECRSLTYF